MAKDIYEYSDKIKIPLFRGQFVQLFKRNNNDKYAITATWEDGKVPDVVKAAIRQACDKAWPGKSTERRKHPKFRNCLCRGRDMVNDEGVMFAGFSENDAVLRINTNNKPGVVDRRRRAIIDAEGTTVTDADNDLSEPVEGNAIYSGAFYMATGCAMAYHREDGFGVSFQARQRAEGARWRADRWWAQQGRKRLRTAG